MDDAFKVRWTIVSDYAAQDESGKLMLGGVYCEDIVFFSHPTVWPPATVTICLAPEIPALKFSMALARGSGERIVTVEGEMTTEATPDENARAVIRFPFPQGPFPGAGTYLVLFGRDPDSLREIHRFQMVVPN